MYSRLATALHKIPVVDTTIGDIIWKNSDLQELNETRVNPSEKLVYEYSLLTQGEVSSKIASLLPTPSLCVYAYNNSNEAFKEGLTENIYTPVEVLTIVNPDKLKVLQDHVIKVQNNELLEHDFLKTPSYAFLELLESSNILDSFLGTIKDTIYASTYVNMLSSIENNPVLHKLITMIVLDSKNTIDYTTAYCIATGTTLVSDTLQAEIGYVKSSRISDAAQAVFNAYSINYCNVVKNVAKNNGISVEMLQTLKLTGSTDTEIASLMLSNSLADIDSDFLVDVMLNTKGSVKQQFLTGSYARSPKNSEIDAIFNRLSPKESIELGEALVEADLVVPWASTLVKYLPRRSLDKLPTYSIFEIYKIVKDKLNSTVNSWDFVLFMSEEWEGTFNELLEASLKIDREVDIDF